jgi:hypothetical protein
LGGAEAGSTRTDDCGESAADLIDRGLKVCPVDRGELAHLTLPQDPHAAMLEHSCGKCLANIGQPFVLGRGERVVERVEPIGHDRG